MVALILLFALATEGLAAKETILVSREYYTYMQNQWVIVIPKSRWARQNLTEKVQVGIRERIVHKPEKICAHQIGDSTFMVSAYANAEIFGYQAPVFLDNSEMCSVAGLPTTEVYSSDPRGNIPRLIAKKLGERGPAELFLRLGGSWNFGHASQQTVTALASYAGYYTCFYTDNSDFFAVGNRAAWIAAFSTRHGELRPDFDQLSWIISTTMILGQGTAYQGVKKLRPGSLLEYSRKSGLKIEQLKENFYTPLPIDGESDKDSFLQTASDNLARRIGWYLERGIPIDAHLTGGKDTRVILGLLLASGSLDRIGRIKTTGSEEHGDVIVAREIARKFGLEKKHAVNNPKKKASKDLNLELISHYFFGCPFKYEAQLTPYDGALTTPKTLPTVVSFMGGAGEIYRQIKAEHHTDKEAVFQNFLNWTYDYNRIGVLSSRALKRQLAFLRNETEQLLLDNIQNQQAKYYIDNRLSNWGCGHIQNSAGAYIAPFCDIDLTRFAFTERNMGEAVHFELLRRTCPQLLEVPFLNDRWRGPTLKVAQRLGVDIDPVEVKMAKNYPWQFQFYREHRDHLIDIAKYSLGAFRPHVSEKALDLFRARKLDPFNSADAKMLCGLVMITRIVSRGEAQSQRLFHQLGDPEVFGNWGEQFELERLQINNMPLSERAEYQSFLHDLSEGSSPPVKDGFLNMLWKKLGNF